MLIKVADYIKKIENLKREHRGIVVDNGDPLKIGRIKCCVHGLIETDNPEKLPWIYPSNGYGLGGSPDTSSFTVPEIGTEVVIKFPYGDVYYPVYFSYWQSENSHQSDTFDEDYPNTYGFIDSTVSFFRINKEKEKVEIHHVSGTSIKIDKDGNIQIDNPGNVTWNIGKTFYLNADKDIIIEAKNNIHIESKTQDTDIVSGKNMLIDVSNNFTDNSGNNRAIKAGNTTGIDSPSIIEKSSKHEIVTQQYVEKANTITMLGPIMSTPALSSAPSFAVPLGSPLGLQVPDQVSEYIHDLEDKIEEIEDLVESLKEIASNSRQHSVSSRQINFERCDEISLVPTELVFAKEFKEIETATNEVEESMSEIESDIEETSSTSSELESTPLLENVNSVSQDEIAQLSVEEKNSIQTVILLCTGNISYNIPPVEIEPIEYVIPELSELPTLDYIKELNFIPSEFFINIIKECIPKCIDTGNSIFNKSLFKTIENTIANFNDNLFVSDDLRLYIKDNSQLDKISKRIGLKDISSMSTSIMSSFSNNEDIEDVDTKMSIMMIFNKIKDSSPVTNTVENIDDHIYLLDNVDDNIKEKVSETIESIKLIVKTINDFNECLKDFKNMLTEECQKLVYPYDISNIYSYIPIITCILSVLKNYNENKQKTHNSMNGLCGEMLSVSTLENIGNSIFSNNFTAFSDIQNSFNGLKNSNKELDGLKNQMSLDFEDNTILTSGYMSVMNSTIMEKTTNVVKNSYGFLSNLNKKINDTCKSSSLLDNINVSNRPSLNENLGSSLFKTKQLTSCLCSVLDDIRSKSIDMMSGICSKLKSIDNFKKSIEVKISNNVSTSEIGKIQEQIEKYNIL